MLSFLDLDNQIDEDSNLGFQSCFRLDDEWSYSTPVARLEDSKQVSVGLGDIGIVIATDGVWKYTSPEKVASILMNYAKNHQAEQAANEIV